MDQRSDDIRQNIESTRASLDAKLDTLEAKARQTLDLKQQIGERPWLALGMAVAAGYMLGSMGDEEPVQYGNGQAVRYYDPNPSPTEHSAQQQGRARSSTDGFMAQFDDEIELLKTAAITTLTNFLHDTIKEYVPALGAQLPQSQQRKPASYAASSPSYSEHQANQSTEPPYSSTLQNLLQEDPSSHTGGTTTSPAERE